MQPQKTLKEITDILSRIKYKNWELRVIQKHEDTILCQWIFMAEDNMKILQPDEKGIAEAQFCRKWYISTFSTTSEIIRTAYKAVQAAEMHEIDENFRLDDVAIFNPHINLLDLKYVMSDMKPLPLIGMDVREDIPQEQIQPKI